jgi:hypothetical protein
VKYNSTLLILGLECKSKPLLITNILLGNDFSTTGAVELANSLKFNSNIQTISVLSKTNLLNH